MSVAIRRAMAEDGPALAAFARRVFTETFGAHYAAGDLAAHLDRAFGPAGLPAELEDPDFRFRMAEDGDDVAAFLKLAPMTLAVDHPPGSLEIKQLYVLAPWQTAEITGWRKSYSEAAAFYFTALPDSYAARTGRPDNVGVIGAAVFRERVPEPVGGWFQNAPSVAKESAANDRLEAQREQPKASADASSSLGAGSPPAARPRSEPALRDERKLGTGHGEREYSPTTQTAFERSSTQPAEVVQIRYDSYANLLAGGIIPRARPLPRQPDAFPSFVADPG